MRFKFKAIYIKRAMSVLWWAILLATAFLLISVLGAKFKGQVPNIFGYSVMKIVSGSMEPTIPAGTYILVRQCDPADVEPGMIISFYSEDPAIYGMPNTHRVLYVEETPQGWSFATQGDASPTQDTVSAKADRLIGVYVGPLNWLTDFSNALDGGLMLMLFVVLQAGTVVVIAGTMLQKKTEEVQKKTDQ